MYVHKRKYYRMVNYTPSSTILSLFKQTFQVSLLLATQSLLSYLNNVLFLLAVSIPFLSSPLDQTKIIHKWDPIR